MASSPPRLEENAIAPPESVTSSADVSSASGAASFALRVGGLPAALSDDAVRALLSHYGASRVRVLRRKKPGAVLHGQTERVTQMAIAEFAERARWQDALQRLAKVQLAGNRLTVDAVGSGDEDREVVAVSGQEKQAISAQGDAVAENGKQAEPTKATGAPIRSFPPPLPPGAPLAPHLGLHYAPSPMLQYKYPKATVPVVRNIANALIALPRFYTQVLHLMNKMNLPTPFEPGAIQGRFSEEFMPEKRPQNKPQFSDQIVEEDEEVEEEELPEQPHRDDAARSSVKRARHASELKAVTGKKRPRVAMGTSSMVSTSDAFNPPRPGVISSGELDRQRVPDAARASDAAFAGYVVGVPSCRVLVSNVAETVDSKDLEYVLGHVLPLQEPLSSIRIKQDVSRSAAVVTFPSLESAERAVALVNGVVLNGQALVVRYAAHETTEPMMDTKSSAPREDNTHPGSEPVNKWERMDPTVLALEKAMKNYQRGDPTKALYLKNLAKLVDETVLRELCKPLLPTSVPPDTLRIRHFAEGRMKNQAFIEFPTPEAAAAVLEGIHGLVVHEKPLVVSFRKAQPSEQLVAPTQHTT